MDTTTSTVEIPLSKRKMALLVAACLAITLGAIWYFFIHGIVFDGGVYISLTAVLGIATPFSAITGIYLMYKLWDRTPGFIIGPDGIVDNSQASWHPAKCIGQI